ncbi:hypothetical protein [Brevundimonas sp. Root1279]|uniref:hypothetical protein n=1 Tax=Brevundimonas sp. Root1279 TaxID=1736443 RepID=UPI0006F43B2C|nr:hypothetical protein [Brevundimonas sp. Root1279]KQW82641.1 hypothetical protein ASC65_10535 [Brevundimonas sp. Root1279]
MSQCQVGRESPQGCKIGPAAIAYFNSGLDLSPVFSPDGFEKPAHGARWVQFEVYRDEAGTVGRLYADRNGVKSVLRERTFAPKSGD